MCTPGVLELLAFAMLVLIFLIPFVLFIWALVDILKSEFQDENNKIIWVVVVLLLPLLGAILYFFIGRKQKRILPG